MFAADFNLLVEVLSGNALLGCDQPSVPVRKSSSSHCHLKSKQNKLDAREKILLTLEDVEVALEELSFFKKLLEDQVHQDAQRREYGSNRH